MAVMPTGAASSAPLVTRHPYSEDEAAKVLAEHDVLVKVDMGTGEASAKAWGCDLTYDYVKINGDYRT